MEIHTEYKEKTVAIMTEVEIYEAITDYLKGRGVKNTDRFVEVIFHTHISDDRSYYSAEVTIEKYNINGVEINDKSITLESKMNHE